MELATIRQAVLENQHFQSLAKQVLANHPDQSTTIRFGDKWTAALRRSSMDLTRILADLRQGR